MIPRLRTRKPFSATHGARPPRRRRRPPPLPGGGLPSRSCLRVAPSVAAPVFAPRVAAKSAPKAAPRATPDFSPHAGPNFGTEVILYEWEAPTASLPGAITLELDAIVQVLPDTNAPTAVFRVYVGATNPGDTTGATLVLTTPNITSNATCGKS